jgi:hypothetical protein
MDRSILRPIDGSFDNSLFQARYQRNNKRGGLKNLRCFPTCAAQHKERGFCGRPVYIRLKTLEGDNLLCYAEFLKSDEPKPISIGHSIPLPKAEDFSRSKEEPLKPWIKGAFSQVANGVTVFEFNREKRGWHYGWASNKHTCNSSHVLVAWIFEKSNSNPNMLTCRGFVESPPFMLFCRRRRRFTLVPSAPIAEPRKSKSALKADDEEDEDDLDDDDDEEEEEEVKPTKKRSAQPAVVPKPKKTQVTSSKSTKRNIMSSSSAHAKSQQGLDVFPAMSASFALGDSALDKNRVDALLSLLYTAWRKMKISENNVSQPAAPLAIASQSDAEFYQMLEFLSGDFDVDGLGLDLAATSTSSSSTAVTTPSNTVVKHEQPSEVEEIEVDHDTEALAKYLLEEPDFRQSVLWLRGQGAQPDFNAFIGILRDHIQKYMKFRFWTVADIDRLIANSSVSAAPMVKSEPSTPWIIGGEEFSWGGTTAAPGSPREFAVDAYLIPNITGVWKQTRDSQLAMEQVRENSGSSWVMSKLFEFMESKFTIQQHGLEMSCRLWPMPALKFVLDGEEHPWGIRLPLFQPNWTYRAWTDGKVITLQHQIDNRRLTRKYWCDPYRKWLHSEATLEVFDPFTQHFVEESRVNQTAERVHS